MKRMMMLAAALLVISGTAGVFASGDKEQPEQQPQAGPWGAPGYRGMPGAGQGPTFSEEKLSVSGELYFKNLIHPVLKSGGKEYYLMAPRFHLYELELQEGTEVSVEGYQVTGMPTGMPYAEPQADKDDLFLWVTKAVIGGKEYDLQRPGFAPRAGMMGGPRGRGDWNHWGPMPYHHSRPYGRGW